MPRTILVYLILIPLLLGVAGSVYGTNTLFAGGPPKPNPDFAIATSPQFQSVAQGSQGNYAIDLSSLNGFAGSVNITARLSPAALGATIAIIPSSVSLLTGSASAEITVTIADSVATGAYLLNITGANRQLYHSVAASLTVIGPKDFEEHASSSFVDMSARSSSNATITLTSVNGFSGNITLVAIVSHGAGVGPVPKANLSTNTVTLAPGETQSAILSLSLPNNPKSQTYTVTVLATNGPLSHSVPITATVQSSPALKQTPQH